MSTLSPDRPVGVAVLSAIRHASYLAPCFVNNPDARLVAIGDEPNLPERWRDRGPKLAAQLGVPFVEDVDALLARPDVDAVCISAEYVRHERLALKTLAAGKHLFLDKPMATSLAQCQAIYAAAVEAERNRVKVMTFSRYTAPTVQRALTAIQDGQIGTVRALHAEYTASYGPGDKYDPVADEYAWHPRWTGGGEILNFALYPLTNVRLLAGQEIEIVQCFGGALFNRAHRELGVDDMATIVLRLSGGAVADVVVGRATTPLHPTKGDVLIHVIGADGMVTADEDGPYVQIYGKPDVGVVFTPADYDLIQDEVDRFVDFVHRDIDPGQSVLDSLRVMEAVFAAEESMRTGSAIRLVQAG